MKKSLDRHRLIQLDSFRHSVRSVPQQVRNPLNPVFYGILMKIQQLRRPGHTGFPVQQIGAQGIQKGPLFVVCLEVPQHLQTPLDRQLSPVDQLPAALGELRLSLAEAPALGKELFRIGQIGLVAQIGLADLAGVLQVPISGQGDGRVIFPGHRQNQVNPLFRIPQGLRFAEKQQQPVSVAVGDHRVRTA